MRASYPGESVPSHLSIAARCKYVQTELIDLGNDQSDVCKLLLPALDRPIVPGRFIVGCHETFDVVGTNEVQTLTLSNGSAGETFKLAFNGSEKTAALAYNISAANLQTALRALTTIDGANVTVSGSDGGPYTITFIGTLAAANQPAIVTSDCTGDLTAVITTPTPGVTAADNSAVVKVGTRKTSTQDVDAIAIIDIAPTMEVGTSAIVEPEDMEETLKTSPGEAPGWPIVQPGYAIEVSAYKNLVAGNAGKVVIGMEYWYLDDVNPVE